ncbi:MAG: pyridine nucleotide-disulfide oxidoreductase, partial [Chitinophagaceae bacterium]
VDLVSFNLPQISRLELSTSTGRRLNQPLPLGGFGISRYLLDATLASIARKKGVEVLENTRTTSINYDGKVFHTGTAAQVFVSRLACAGFGKRSNLDLNWERPFVSKTRNPLNNYIGVKYHVRGDFRKDTVFLHLFDKGYVGLVKIESDLYNLCYLSGASNLKLADNSIEKMEDQVLSKNPAIRDLFSRIEKVDNRPVTISQISFESKSSVENNVLLFGDAAGMITPLCGNGMSMALHSSKLGSELIAEFLEGKMSQQQLESIYSTSWQQRFAARMKTGRSMQRILSVPVLASALVGLGSLSPFVIRQLIRRTHGRPF